MDALSRSPISDTHFYISGSVVIDPSAAIAPGVLIQAEIGAQVVVHAGVCIGRGSIIHAASGSIELGEGAILGSGVLAFGTCSVGAGACVGANVTLVNYAVKPGQSVPANSVLSTLEVPTVTVQNEASSKVPSESNSSNGARYKDSAPQTHSVESPTSENPNTVESEVHTTDVKITTQQVVYGRSSLEKVMSMMFPHRQPLGSVPSDSDNQQSSQDKSGLE